LCDAVKAVRRKVVGAEEPEDILLTEDDPARFVTIGQTKNGALVTVNTNSKISSEVGPPRLASRVPAKLALIQGRHGRQFMTQPAPRTML
jgi:hypothetical protein